jgi:2'-hydroxyisoflavone reductase
MLQKILIIGGTQMIGRDFVELCLENNIKPTLVNRGVTNKDIFSNLKTIHVDRKNKDSCTILKKEQEYDMVIDFSCYCISDLVNIIDNISYKKYILLSTLCVMDNLALNDTKHWLHHYCLNKKILENYINANKLKDFLIVRPCVLYGKYDYTNRFYEKDNIIYWKHNNSPVIESKYYIHVRKFSSLLYEYLSNNTLPSKLLHIDSDGVTRYDY